MKKILIFYSSYGGGHLSAAKSVKAYIEENYSDVEIKLADCIEIGSKFIYKTSIPVYTFIALNIPSLWKAIYFNAEKGLFYRISKILNKKMSNNLGKFIGEFQPDIIICTHFFAGQMCTILKKENRLNCPLYTIMTDLHIHNQWLINSEYMDKFFVSNEEMKSQMFENGIPDEKVIVTGMPFSNRFLQTYNRDDVLKEFGLKDGKMTVLFFAGGGLGLGKKRTFDIFESFVSNFPDLQIIAVAGKNEKSQKRFNECVKKYNREDSVCVLGFTQKVPELMSISDFVVTKPGGLTSTESFISGLPMIVINPIPGHEEQNAEFIENSNVGIWLRDKDEIKSTLEKFISSKENLDVMHKNALGLARPNALKDICSAMDI